MGLRLNLLRSLGQCIFLWFSCWKCFHASIHNFRLPFAFLLWFVASEWQVYHHWCIPSLPIVLVHQVECNWPLWEPRDYFDLPFRCNGFSESQLLSVSHPLSRSPFTRLYLHPPGQRNQTDQWRCGEGMGRRFSILNCLLLRQMLRSPFPENL